MYNSLLNGLQGFIASEEYREFGRQEAHLKHDEKVMRQVKAHNSKFTRVATASNWQKFLGRDPKSKVKPFMVIGSDGKELWMLDESQTSGRPIIEIYSNISGELAYFEPIWDCLTTFATLPVVIGDSYYEGIGKDSITKDGQIVLRPALSQQQQIFALVREIVRNSQTSAIVVEAVSYMVCRHLQFDTSAFSYGYLLELMGHDVSLAHFSGKDIASSIVCEAEVLIGYIKGSLPYLQSSSSESSSSNDSSSSEIAQIEPPPTATPKEEEPKAVDFNTPTTQKHVHTVSEVEFPVWQIFKDFLRIPPDRKLNLAEVRGEGYKYENMHPIRESIALKLFKDKREIYKLYKDNTETRAESIADISNHKWHYGIRKSDWYAMQLSTVQDCLNAKDKEINLLEQSEKRGQARGRSQTQQAGTNQPPQNLPAQNKLEKQRLAQTQKQEKGDELGYEPKFDANGNEILDAPDLKFADTENLKWIEENFDAFFEISGYRYADLPYFAERESVRITEEMKKLNSCMAEFIFYKIIDELKASRRVSKKTGKILFLVPEAVSNLLGEFNASHIANALKVYWKEIPFHDKVKVEFYSCFAKMRKTTLTKTKKSTPDDDTKRIKAKGKIAEGGSPDNVDENPKNKYTKVIIGLIETYRENVKSAPKAKKSKPAGFLAKREEHNKQR